MDLERGALRASLGAADRTAGLRTESFIAADKDALVVRLEAVGSALTLTVGAEVPQSATTVSGSAPWVLPTEAGHDTGGSIHAGRQGVNQVDNNVLLNTCGRGGQHAGAQRFALSTNGDLTLRDGRCLVLAGSPTGQDCANTTRLITIGSCANTGASAWVFDKTSGQLWLSDSSGATFYAGLPLMKPPPPPPPYMPQPGYIYVSGAVGGQNGGGRPLCNCTSLKACPAEAAAQCNASSGCESFAVLDRGARPPWNGCQLYDAKDTAEHYPDKGWNLWKRKPATISTERTRVSEGDAFVPVPFVLASVSPASTPWTYDRTTGMLSAGVVSRPAGSACCSTPI
jgi:hypothetical protein